MKPLPLFLKQYFWDVEFEKIDTERSAVFIMKRIMEYGDEKAVTWMNTHFTKKAMCGVLRRYRGLSKKSVYFWSLILDVPEEEIACLNRPFREMPETAWPY
ncbi:DUF6922 domain-containing protein [Planctomycetota bacterium]